VTASPFTRVRMALTIALATAFALGSLWLLEVLRRSAEAPEQPPSVQEPDYTVDRFTFVRLSQTGRMRYRVAGVKLTHYVNDMFEIERPVLHQISEQAPPLDAQSERGVVDDAARKIYMYQDVKLDRPQSAERQDFMYARNI
jgi:lipopolysaccharide export system protein LptC